MKLGPGDMYLHPAKVPHSPARTEGSVGLVIERKEPAKDLMMVCFWFCDNCNHKLHEVYFRLHDIEKRIFYRISAPSTIQKKKERVKMWHCNGNES